MNDLEGSGVEGESAAELFAKKNRDRGQHALPWAGASILKELSMSQTKCTACIKQKSQSQIIVRSAV